MKCHSLLYCFTRHGIMNYMNYTFWLVWPEWHAGFPANMYYSSSIRTTAVTHYIGFSFAFPYVKLRTVVQLRDKKVLCEAVERHSACHSTKHSRTVDNISIIKNHYFWLRLRCNLLNLVLRNILCFSAFDFIIQKILKQVAIIRNPWNHNSDCRFLIEERFPNVVILILNGSVKFRADYEIASTKSVNWQLKQKIFVARWRKNTSCKECYCFTCSQRNIETKQNARVHSFLLIK